MKLLLWQARTAKNMTLEELEKLTGISHGALGNYENGMRCPNMEQMEKIAEALKCRIQDLYESEWK